MAPMELDVDHALVLVADQGILHGCAAEGNQVCAVHVATARWKNGRNGIEHTDVGVARGELDEFCGRAMEEELQRLVERLHADLGARPSSR